MKREETHRLDVRYRRCTTANADMAGVPTHGWHSYTSHCILLTRSDSDRGLQDVLSFAAVVVFPDVVAAGLFPSVVECRDLAQFFVFNIGLRSILVMAQIISGDSY